MTWYLAIRDYWPDISVWLYQKHLGSHRTLREPSICDQGWSSRWLHKGVSSRSRAVGVKRSLWITSSCANHRKSGTSRLSNVLRVMLPASSLIVHCVGLLWTGVMCVSLPFYCVVPRLNECGNITLGSFAKIEAASDSITKWTTSGPLKMVLFRSCILVIPVPSRFFPCSWQSTSRVIVYNLPMRLILASYRLSRCTWIPADSRLLLVWNYSRGAFPIEESREVIFVSRGLESLSSLDSRTACSVNMFLSFKDCFMNFAPLNIRIFIIRIRVFRDIRERMSRKTS